MEKVLILSLTLSHSLFISPFDSCLVSFWKRPVACARLLFGVHFVFIDFSSFHFIFSQCIRSTAHQFRVVLPFFLCDKFAASSGCTDYDSRRLHSVCHFCVCVFVELPRERIDRLQIFLYFLKFVSFLRLLISLLFVLMWRLLHSTYTHELIYIHQYSFHFIGATSATLWSLRTNRLCVCVVQMCGWANDRHHRCSLLPSLSSSPSPSFIFFLSVVVFGMNGGSAQFDFVLVNVG